MPVEAVAAAWGESVLKRTQKTGTTDPDLLRGGYAKRNRGTWMEDQDTALEVGNDITGTIYRLRFDGVE